MGEFDRVQQLRRGADQVIGALQARAVGRGRERAGGGQTVVAKIEQVGVGFERRIRNAAPGQVDEMTIDIEVGAVGHGIVFAEDAIGIPHVGIVDMQCRNAVVDHAQRIVALPVLAPQHVADVAMQWRGAMFDFLAPERDLGLGQAAVAQVGLLDLGALRVDHRRA